MGEQAGVDLGTTFTKIAWYKGEKISFALGTGDKCYRIEQRVQELIKDGVKTAIVTGINKEDEPALSPLVIIRHTGDPITNELQIQAKGARKLLELEGKSIDDFLLVSIGTGTSYTIVRGDEVGPFPFGNGIGGGFIEGIMQLARAPLSVLNDPELLEEGGMFYRAIYDKLVKEVMPETAGTFRGELAIAHFGSVPTGMVSNDNVGATVLNCVATTVIRDIIKLGMMPDWKPPKTIVFVGGVTGRFPAMRTMLEKYSKVLTENLPSWEHQIIFPKNGEFAGALGALEFGK